MKEQLILEILQAQQQKKKLPKLYDELCDLISPNEFAELPQTIKSAIGQKYGRIQHEKNR